MTREEILYSLNEIKYYLSQKPENCSYIDKINDIIKELRKPVIEQAPQQEDFMPIPAEQSELHTLISIGVLNINNDEAAAEIIKALYPPSNEPK